MGAPTNPKAKDLLARLGRHSEERVPFALRRSVNSQKWLEDRAASREKRNAERAD